MAHYVGRQWKNLGVQEIIRPSRNVLADILDNLADHFDHLADHFDHLADNFDHLADNFDHIADKNVREIIPGLMICCKPTFFHS